MTRSSWQYLDAFPPPYCRLLAKEPGGGTCDMAVTDAELAIRSGIPISRIRAISSMDDWQQVTLGEMRAFFIGCNFDPTEPTHRNRVNQYNKICTKRKTVPFHYLRRSPKWETEFLPLYLKVLKIMQSSDESSQRMPASVTHARS